MANTQVRSGEKSKALKRRLKIIMAVIAVVVVAAGAGVGLRWWQMQAPAPVQTLSREADEAQSFVLKGDYDKAQESINNSLKNPDLSTQSRYELLMQQAYAYEGQRDSNGAMEAYLRAEEVSQTMDVAQCIARLAADRGDKELAVSYYQKALTLISSDDVMRDAYKRHFENSISVLQGGEPKYD